MLGSSVRRLRWSPGSQRGGCNPGGLAGGVTQPLLGTYTAAGPAPAPSHARRCMRDTQTCTHALSSLLVNDQSPWGHVPARPGTQPDPGLGWRRRRRDVLGGVESFLGLTSQPSGPEGQEPGAPRWPRRPSQDSPRALPGLRTEPTELALPCRRVNQGQGWALLPKIRCCCSPL